MKPPKIITLKIGRYKKYHILTQAIGQTFQYIIFHRKKFYSGYVNILYDKGKRSHTDETLGKGASYIYDMAVSTVELLLNKKNPDKLIKKNALGDQVAKALGKLNGRRKKK